MKASFKQKRILGLWRTFTILLLILAFLSSSYSKVLAQETTTLDPAPLIVLLHDVESKILKGDYSGASKLCHEALNITLPPYVSATHTRVYEDLLKLSNIMEYSEHVVSKGEVNPLRIKEIIYELYDTKMDLEEALNAYLNRLRNEFKDKATGFVMVKNVQELTEAFLRKTEGVMYELVRIYLRGNLNVNNSLFGVNITIPDSIIGGKEFSVKIFVKSPRNVMLANISIVAVYANFLVREKTITVPTNAVIEVPLKAPSAEELAEITGENIKEAPVKVMVLARAFLDNTTLVDYVVSQSTLNFLKPPCVFSIPKIVYPDKPLKIDVYSKAEEPLRATVFFDKKRIYNVTINPGANVFYLNIENATEGLHKLMFILRPKGPYYGLTYSVSFAIVKKELSVSVEYEKVVVAPPFESRVYIKTGAPVNYRVVVYVGSSKIAEKIVENNVETVVNIGLPPTFLTWKYRVKILVEPLNEAYGSSEKVFETYVINLPVLIIATAILGFAMTTPVTSRYIAPSLNMVFQTLRRTWKPRYSEKTIGKTGSYRIAGGLTVSFRSSKLSSLYRRFIKIMSKFVVPPKASETLREFGRRVIEKVPERIRKLVVKFIGIYEKDLYSTKHVSVGEAEKTIREIEEAVE